MDQTIEAYDLKGMTVELQQMFRVQDWDIETIVVSNNVLYRDYEHDNVQGDCTRDRYHKQALIRMNGDHVDNREEFGQTLIKGWLPTLIHEMLHVFVDDLSSVAESGGYYDTNSKECKQYEERYKTQQESLINRTTRLVLSMMDVEAFLARHRKDDQHEATKTTE